MMTPSRALSCAALGLLALLAGCERPPVETVQRGYRGTGMVEVYNPRILSTKADLNQVPAGEPAAAPPSEGPRASQVFQNVKVLGDLSVAEFSQLMVSMTAWVSPDQGCNYCHKAENLAADDLYTKVVARRMLEMTRHINADWKPHVAATGVTCYTCHRGQPVPSAVWFTAPQSKQASRAIGDDAQQNKPAATVGLSSLPYDPFTPFLLQSNDIRVVGNTPLKSGNLHSIKQTEFTYGLMTHMSEGLGVNCTYCHNSRSFTSWDSSPPQRVTAWHGIRMARDLNVNYLTPLTSTFPAERLGPTGDVAKVNCATCHQGAYKPLYGAQLLAVHPGLTGSTKPPALPPTVSSAQGATLYFGVGSATLAGDAVTGLQALIEALKTNATSKVTISGFHSAAGDLAQNQELAKNRALAVRDTLQSAGVPAERFSLLKPVSAEANVAGEDPSARRVEVAVVK
jgi:photosynthetic reaction center cytochrome c subunit